MTALRFSKATASMDDPSAISAATVLGTIGVMLLFVAMHLAGGRHGDHGGH
jgi:hypothetical protein